MIDKPDTDIPGHGREGSTTCCQVLLLLHKHPTNGLPTTDIQVFLGLDRQNLEQALIGLRTRRRIACIGGRGTNARWMLQQHAAALAQDAAP